MPIIVLRKWNVSFIFFFLFKNYKLGLKPYLQMFLILLIFIYIYIYIYIPTLFYKKCVTSNGALPNFDSEQTL
jgi:hypothetical protein